MTEYASTDAAVFDADAAVDPTLRAASRATLDAARAEIVAAKDGAFVSIVQHPQAGPVVMVSAKTARAVRDEDTRLGRPVPTWAVADAVAVAVEAVAERLP